MATYVTRVLDKNMKRRLAVVLSSLLVISIFVIIPGFPKAHAGTFPGVNGKIAFASFRDGNFEIYVMNADGTDQTRLTNDPAEDHSSSTSSSLNPSWSPDGTKIAFESDRDNHDLTTDLYVMNADGTDVTRLTNSPATSDYASSWSPDGTKIAFVSDRDGNTEIYIMHADGSGQTRLTTNTAKDFDPSWSPDGTKIAFESNRDGNSEIYVMNADGTDQTRLTNSPSGDLEPSWSPDGTKIAFDSERDGNSEIYVMNADGTDQTRLTNSPSFDVQPDWGPQPSISGENALVADKGVISLGETTKLIQKIDASSGLTGNLVSLRVLEADGDTCVANGVPETIPASGIMRKVYPTDFSLDTSGGDGACNTAQIGTYKATSEVEVGGVVSKSTV
ncbi:MAG: hypothetical protein E6K92_10400, partial [Thaumarchaeota archaeon]